MLAGFVYMGERIDGRVGSFGVETSRVLKAAMVGGRGGGDYRGRGRCGGKVG